MTGYYDKRFRDEFEAVVAEAYADELRRTEITAKVGFATLGGDSDGAVRVAARIDRSVHTGLTGETVLRYDTVERLAHYLRSRAALDSCVQLSDHSGPDTPILFYFHSASGNAFAIRTLRKVLPVRLAGVRAAGLHGERPVPRTIEEFAESYLPEIRRVQPEGPYLLCGFSAGGEIAFETACRLRAMGHDVPLLALFDADSPEAEPEPATEAELMDGRLKELLRRIGDVPADDVRAGDEDVVETLRRGKALADEMGADELRRQLVVFARTWRAVELYRPGRFDGALHLFAAEMPAESVAGWQAHAEQVLVHDIDAEHYEYSIFANEAFRATFTRLVRDVLGEGPEIR